MNIYRFTLLERIAWDAEAAAQIRAAQCARRDPAPDPVQIRMEFRSRSKADRYNRTGIPAAMLRDMSMEDLFKAMRV